MKLKVGVLEVKILEEKYQSFINSPFFLLMQVQR